MSEVNTLAPPGPPRDIKKHWPGPVFVNVPGRPELPYSLTCPLPIGEVTAPKRTQ
jgi:hypothetical protein